MAFIRYVTGVNLVFSEGWSRNPLLTPCFRDPVVDPKAGGLGGAAPEAID